MVSDHAAHFRLFGVLVGLILQHQGSCPAKLSRLFLQLLRRVEMKLADVPGLEELTGHPQLKGSGLFK